MQTGGRGRRYWAWGVEWDGGMARVQANGAVFRMCKCKNSQSLSWCALGMAPASLGQMVASINEEERI